MSDPLYVLDSSVERPILHTAIKISSKCKRMQLEEWPTHGSHIVNDNNLKLLSISRENGYNFIGFGLRADSTADGESPIKEVFDNPEGDEAVGTFTAD